MTTYQSRSGWVPGTHAFGARLALVRHEMRWNLKEAALACGLPQGSWREWELKGRDPRGLQQVVKRICESTGADEYWLLTGNGPPPDPFSGARASTEDSEDGRPHDPSLTSKPLAQLVAIADDIADDAIHYVAMAENDPAKSVTLRLTAECSARLSYRGLPDDSTATFGQRAAA